MTHHTTPLTHGQAEKLRAVLMDRGFEFVEKPYTLYAAQKPQLSIAVYTKGPKVLIQGKQTEDFVRFTLEPEITGEAIMDYQEVHDPEAFQPHFGIDESGKGDYFGPLVVAGVYTDGPIARSLQAAGVMDSKRIHSASKIRQLAEIIRNTPGCVNKVLAISPARYNEMMPSFKNLNRLLAWGHARVIEECSLAKPDCPRALSDQFARREVLESALRAKKITLKLDQRTKGESDIAVAAASIIARERFLDWMAKASETSGLQLPLGASQAVIDAGLALVEKKGREHLPLFAKIHFRTTQKILGQADPLLDLE